MDTERAARSRAIEALAEALWAEVQHWPGAGLLYYRCERETCEGLVLAQSLDTENGQLLILDAPDAATWMVFRQPDTGRLAWRRLSGSDLPDSLKSDCRALLQGRRRPRGWFEGSGATH